MCRSTIQHNAFALIFGWRLRKTKGKEEEAKT
jgi:hypothetical protein